MPPVTLYLPTESVPTHTTSDLTMICKAWADTTSHDNDRLTSLQVEYDEQLQVWQSWGDGFVGEVMLCKHEEGPECRSPAIVENQHTEREQV